MRSGVNLALISVRSSSPSSKWTVMSRARTTRGVLAAGTQAHLDPLLFAVEQRHVVEVGGVELRLQLAVEDVQDVAVELGRDALGVVVGGLAASAGP